MSQILGFVTKKKLTWAFLVPKFHPICTFIPCSPVRIDSELQLSSLFDESVNFHLPWQRAFSPEGLSEMWNEMVIDEEITFNREESAHTGKVVHPENRSTLSGTRGSQVTASCVVSTEDCTDCFGSQKKDETNDKEKKEDEDLLTSVHHSIIETWDWGRQPGERGFPRAAEAH